MSDAFDLAGFRLQAWWRSFDCILLSLDTKFYITESFKIPYRTVFDLVNSHWLRPAK